MYLKPKQHTAFYFPNSGILTMADSMDRHQTDTKKHQMRDLRFRMLTETINDVFWMSTLGIGKMIYVSPGYTRVWERSIEELYRSPKTFLDAMHPDDLAPYLAVVKAYNANGIPYECEYRIIQNNGSIKWIHERGFPVAELWDGEQLMAGICTEITSRKQSEEQLARLQKHHELILTSTGDGVYGIDLQGRVTFVNPAATDLLGWNSDELINNELHPIIHHSRADMTPLTSKECRIYATLLDGKSRTISDDVFWRKNGSYFPVEYSCNPIYENDKISGAVVNFRDISNRLKADQQIQYLATHDALTALPNRALFMDRLDQAVARADRENNLIAVMFVDLDGFKAINDTHGHEVGDQVLKMVATGMRKRLRQSDTVARIGGDEFAIILNNAGKQKEVSNIANQIAQAVSMLQSVQGHAIQIGASIGIALYPQGTGESLTGTQILRSADDAMYRAKRNGKGQPIFASPLIIN